MYKGTKRKKKPRETNQTSTVSHSVLCFFVDIVKKKNIRGNSVFFFLFFSLCWQTHNEREKERERKGLKHKYIYSGERKSPKKEKEKT
jgi:hypothetical protein